MKPKGNMESIEDSEEPEDADGFDNSGECEEVDSDDSGGGDDDDDDDNADGDMFPQETLPENGVNGASNGEDVEEEEEEKVEEEPSSKRRRVISKSMTSAEASALTSTETSLDANLFKFQTREMLKEIQIQEEIRSKKISTFIEKIERILRHSPSATAASASASKMLQHIEDVDGIKLPFRPVVFSSFESNPMGGSFQFAPPAAVDVAGCYRLGVVCKPRVVVDVAVEMPASLFQKKDVSNLRYAFKRAAFLAHVASILKKEMNELNKGGAELNFDGSTDDPFRPRLTIVPNWSFVKRETDLDIVFSLFCFANENPHLRAEKLRFENSLVEEEWFFGAAWKSIVEKANEEEPILYAAHYENDLLRDLTYRRNQAFLEESVFAPSSANLREGVMLLHTWLRQRGFDDRGGVSNDALVAFVAYLLSFKKTLTKEMSAVQVFRKLLVAFTNNAFETGASLYGGVGEDAENRRRRLETFFDVVVLDRTGSCNLTPTLSKLTLRRVGMEARAALACLDDAHSQDAFDALFLHSVPLEMQFDQIFVVVDATGKGFEKVVHKEKLWASILRDSGSTLRSSVAFIIDLLGRALGRRVTSISVLPPVASCANKRRSWSLESFPSSIEQSEIRIGLNLNVEAFASIIEKGPAPEERQEVEEFRRFWGPKVETRRFKDATIAEAVVWTAKTTEVRRRLNVQIVEHILSIHAGISAKEIHFVGDQVEKKILRFKKVKKTEQPSKRNAAARFGTGEEQQTACLAAFESLSKTLRSLSDIKSRDALPLRITSVQGISPVFRQTDPCPPLPSFYGQSTSVTKPLLRDGAATVALGKKGSRIVEQLGDRVPRDDCDDVNSVEVPDWVPTLRALLTLELSGKWPEDLDALRRVKSSFLTSVCKCLRGMSISASLSTDCVRALKDGFVFEFRIAHPRELALLKRDEDAESGEEETTPSFLRSASATFKRRHFALPHLASVVNGLNAQFPAFGPTCRLIKRWVASQLLIDFFPDDAVAIELIVAYAFLHPHPFATPAVNPQSGFLRVLRLLSTWNWKSTPMIVNFNEEFSTKEYREKHRQLSALRRQQIERFASSSTPSLFVVTPYDKVASEWTLGGPPLFILSRLVAVAKASLRTILDSLKTPVSPSSKIQRPDCLPAFRPPLEGFNVLIHLRKSQLPTRWWSVDCMEPPEALTTHLKARAKGLMPVNGFDPARRLVEDLRRCYDETCYFFHDPFGGEIIAVLWRPDSLCQRPLAESAMTEAGLTPGLRFVEKTVGALTGDVIEDLGKRKIHVEFNVEAFVEDVKILGDGIVEDVRVQTENWS